MAQSKHPPDCWWWEFDERRNKAIINIGLVMQCSPTSPLPPQERMCSFTYYCNYPLHDKYIRRPLVFLIGEAFCALSLLAHMLTIRRRDRAIVRTFRFMFILLPPSYLCAVQVISSAFAIGKLMRTPHSDTADNNCMTLFL